MADLVKIETGWTWRKLTETNVRFEVKPLGTAFYLVRFPDGTVIRHLKVVVDQMSEAVK